MVHLTVSKNVAVYNVTYTVWSLYTWHLSAGLIWPDRPPWGSDLTWPALRIWSDMTRPEDLIWHDPPWGSNLTWPALRIWSDMTCPEDLIWPNMIYPTRCDLSLFGWSDFTALLTWGSSQLTCMLHDLDDLSPDLTEPVTWPSWSVTWPNWPVTWNAWPVTWLGWPATWPI